MDVSPRKRSKIVTLHDHTTKTQRQIAAEVGVNQSTVSRIIARYKKSGSFSPTRISRCGRKSRISKKGERRLVRDNRVNPRMTSNEHRISLQLDVSSRTVRRILVKYGRRARRPLRKQLLTPQMKKKRLAWAKRYREWTAGQWRKVLFSDETHFIVQGQQVRYIRRASGEALSHQHVNQTVKHPQKVMFWGCFSAAGPGRLHVCEGMMRTEQYIKIIDSRIVPELNEKFPDGNCTLQQDKAPCHTSKKSIKHLQSKAIRLLEWPGNSPDLAPIETLWAIIKYKLKEMNVTTKEKLISAVLKVWYRDERIRESCIRLADSMPQRIKQVITNKGGHIRY